MVIALISYYDELPSWLEETVKSLQILDVRRVVAVDGAYAMFPGGKASSGRESHDALAGACERYGMELVHHVPESVWHGNEIEKRNFLFSLAEQHSTDRDWYFVVDADERVIGVEGELNLQGDVATARLLEETPKETKVFPALRMFFRARRGIHVVHNHYTYMCGDDMLWGTLGDPEVPAVDSGVMVEHLTWQRERDRLDASHEYYKRRTEERAEAFSCHWCRGLTTERIPFLWERRVKDGKPDIHGLTVGACDSCRPEALKESERQFAAAIGSERVSISLPS